MNTQFLYILKHIWKKPELIINKANQKQNKIIPLIFPSLSAITILYYIFILFGITQYIPYYYALLINIFGGTVLGIGFHFFFCYVITLAGKLINLRTKFKTYYNILGWANIYSIFQILLIIIQVIVKKSFYGKYSSLVEQNAEAIFTYGIFLLFIFLFLYWFITTIISLVSDINNCSTKKSLLNILLTVITMTITFCYIILVFYFLYFLFEKYNIL